MKIKIKRIDKSLPLPKYQTHGSAGFDIYTRKQMTIQPGEIKLAPGNIIVETPPGYMLLLASRSSLPIKKGLMVPNGVGIIDHDYCGDEDEIHVSLYNFKNKNVTIEKGERIAQGVFIKVEHGEWVEVEKMNNSNRGGFGSTGTHI